RWQIRCRMVAIERLTVAAADGNGLGIVAIPAQGQLEGFVRQIESDEQLELLQVLHGLGKSLDVWVGGLSRWGSAGHCPLSVVARGCWPIELGACFKDAGVRPQVRTVTRDRGRHDVGRRWCRSERCQAQKQPGPAIPSTRD